MVLSAAAEAGKSGHASGIVIQTELQTPSMLRGGDSALSLKIL